ncbi:Der1-like protein, partial [Rozella allomycis CSF55]
EMEVQTWFRSLPFCTRYILLLSISVPLLVRFNIISPYSLILTYEKAVIRLQIWRFITCLFPLSINFNTIFLLFFRYRYSLELETGHFNRRTADYAYFLTLLVVGSSILALTFEANFEMPSAFTIAILYLWSKLNPSMTVSFLFGITFQAQYLAFAMIALDFLMGGPIMGSLIGVFVCHVYHFFAILYPSLHGRVYVKTPQLL